MNISVYLPDRLKKSLDAYVKTEGISQNAGIRKAVELLLEQEGKKKWGNWLEELEPDPEFPDVNDLRKDLIPPTEHLL